MELRRSPPWTNGPYQHAQQCTKLRVGYADGFYIACGPGGHIVASTQDPLELAALIRLESERGLYAVEYLARGDEACPGSALAQGLRRKAAPAGTLSLEDLGL